ncbi:MAG: aldo/keto reductase [Phenylobacterium sp.]|nr:aldo/keto reductase [Phenylobacterium sp.]
MSTTSTDPVPLGPLSVSRQGFGCMGLSHTYGKADEAESLATLDRAVELGINFFDTADVYGLGHNEELLAKAIRGRRDRLVIASKFGNRLDRETSGRALDGRPEYMRQAVDASLRRLEVEHIDLYYLHRLDPLTPIEETVGELVRLKEQGKIGAVGLSEVDAGVLRRAHAVHPIAALQSEYSLWTREVEADILPAARELGIGFVAYSPLGRGFLAGAEPVEANDRRNLHPRFQPDAIAATASAARWLLTSLNASASLSPRSAWLGSCRRALCRSPAPGISPTWKPTGRRAISSSIRRPWPNSKRHLPLDRRWARATRRARRRSRVCNRPEPRGARPRWELHVDPRSDCAR